MAPHGMQFWQALTFTEPDQILAVVKICEAVGFDGVIIGDHVLHFKQAGAILSYASRRSSCKAKRWCGH